MHSQAEISLGADRCPEVTTHRLSSAGVADDSPTDLSASVQVADDRPMDLSASMVSRGSMVVDTQLTEQERDHPDGSLITWSKAQLLEEVRVHGLKIKGNKVDLIVALRIHMKHGGSIRGAVKSRQ